MLQFGTSDERFEALVGLGSTSLDLETAKEHLYPIASGEATEDDNERLWASISLAELGDRNGNVRDGLIDALRFFAKNPDAMSPAGMLERQAVRALSRFSHDDVASDGLREIVEISDTGASNTARALSQALVTNCLRGIGAIGHDNGKEMLGYWSGLGKIAAQAALAVYGSSWDDIRTKEKEMTESNEENYSVEKAANGKELIGTEVNEKLLHELASICEDDPNQGLVAICSAVEQHPQLDTNPLIMFSRAECYRSKGMSRVVAALEDDSCFDLATASAEAFRNVIGVTDEELDLIELAFIEFGKLEEASPTFYGSMDPEEARNFGLVNDSMANVLVRCRPGRLEEISPRKFKLSYLGYDNVKVHPSASEQAVKPFLELPLAVKTYASSSLLVMGDGSDYTGRKYLHVTFFKHPFTILGPGETFERLEYNGSKYIFEDGTSSSSLPQRPEMPKESQAPKKKGLFSRLLGL